jgi:hypothetical protein
MTLKAKNIIFNTTSLICILNFIALIVLLARFPIIRGINQSIIFTISTLLFFTTIFIQVFYKKSLSAEVILFVIFLVSLSVQSIRIIEPLINYNSYIITLIIARTSIFFKYLALLSLLGASLFSFSIKKQKVGSWVLISIFISLILSVIIHFNTGIVEYNLLPKIIYAREEIVISAAIMIITVLTFIKSGFDAKNMEYIYLGIASFLLTLGLEMTFISLELFPGIVTCILLISGIILYLKSIHTIILWG